MNAEGFAVRGALVADSSLCPSRLFRKDLRTRNTTSIVTTRNATPSPAAIIQRCCALFPACSAVNIKFEFCLYLSPLSHNAPHGWPLGRDHRPAINNRQRPNPEKCPQRQLVLPRDRPS